MRNCLIILFGVIIGCIIYLLINNKIELANFIVTAAAFGAAIYAIYNQHLEGKQAEKNFQTQFNLQKEAALKQEIIGAWQVLANKAPGNSGKKEAIEFLASQGIPLCGIDMSSQTHGGRVYLAGLFKDSQGDRKKINLNDANFSVAILNRTDFSEASLFGTDFSEASLFWTNFSRANLYQANFSGAVLFEANFSGANLYGANFLGAILFDDKGFIDCYCYFDNTTLPLPPPGYKFEFENRTDENNQPIYPKNDPNYRYIKLIKLK